jgi:hypothetical protein
MTENSNSITIGITELETLVKWINTMDPHPRVVKIVATATGIGTHFRAEVETAEGEGRFKDLTDYESW